MPRPGRKVERNIKAGVPAAKQRRDILTFTDCGHSPIMAMSPAAEAMSAAAAMSPAAAMSSWRTETRGRPGRRRGWLQQRLDSR